MCRFDYVLTGTRGRSTKTGKLCRHGAFHVCGGEEFARPLTLLGSDRTAHAPR